MLRGRAEPAKFYQGADLGSDDDEDGSDGAGTQSQDPGRKKGKRACAVGVAGGSRDDGGESAISTLQHLLELVREVGRHILLL